MEGPAATPISFQTLGNGDGCIVLLPVVYRVRTSTVYFLSCELRTVYFETVIFI
jgi:hypothetical protein